MDTQKNKKTLKNLIGKLLTNLIYLIILIPFLSFGQKVSIELKNGYKTVTDKIRYVNKGKTIVFEDINGIKKVKAGEVKLIKPISLPKDKFVYNQLGLTPFVVEKFDSIPQKKLMKLIKDWIKETYKNPDKVIKSIIDNRKIRFEGYSDSDISMKGIGQKIYTGITYSIVISVKDNKYKFQPISLGGIDLRNGSGYFKKTGLPKYAFIDMVVEVGELFNKLNLSLKEYIEKNQNGNNSDEEDW